MRAGRIVRRVALALSLAAACGGARAGSLRVTPVGLDLPAAQSATTLTLGDDADAAMTVQIRVYRWTQVEGQDRLEPTQDVVVSPPIGALAAHAERVVRVVRLGAPATGEASYRLVVDELPPPPGTGGRQVRLLMRHSIPLFFGSGALDPKALAWRVTAGADGLMLEGRNTGARRVRVNNLKVLDGAGRELSAHPGLLGYVLAGSTARWNLPGDVVGKAARLTADTEAGAIDVAIAPAG